MAYSNDMTQIRAGLVNYIGACLNASPFESRAARHTVASILIEEALNLSQEEKDVPYDLYVLKPMLRANAILYKQRIQELEKLPNSKPVSEQIDTYKRMLEDVSNLINTL